MQSYKLNIMCNDVDPSSDAYVSELRVNVAKTGDSCLVASGMTASQILVILPRLVSRLAVHGMDRCSAPRELQTFTILIFAVRMLSLIHI